MIAFKDAELIEAVLEQNEALRLRYGGFEYQPQNRIFHRLRRCPICLESICADRARCRSMLDLYAREAWDRAIRDATGKEVDPANPY